MTPRLHILRGDLTTEAADAIVNAANQKMLGGGGVDGAIHRAAGPGLLEACRTVPEVRSGVRCPTGEARITSGFDLPARYVVHTVGPIYRGASGDASSPLSTASEHSPSQPSRAVSMATRSGTQPGFRHRSSESGRGTSMRSALCCFRKTSSRRGPPLSRKALELEYAARTHVRAHPAPNA